MECAVTVCHPDHQSRDLYKHAERLSLEQGAGWQQEYSQFASITGKICPVLPSSEIYLSFFILGRMIDPRLECNSDVAPLACRRSKGILPA